MELLVGTWVWVQTDWRVPAMTLRCDARRFGRGRIRALIAGLLVTLVVDRAAVGGTQIFQAIRQPVYVEIQMDSPAEWLDPASSTREAHITEVVDQARAAANANPRRLITLRVTDLRMRYERLPQETRQVIEDLAGDPQTARTWY